MRLYLDSADVHAAAQWLPTGLIAGVTSNPLLLQRAGVSNTLANVIGLIHTWHDLHAPEVHVQVWGENVADMWRCAEQIWAATTALDLTVVIKVPATLNGLKVAQQIRQQRHPVTLTAVYAPQQALLAHGVGATYLAPYLGRMNDQGCPGIAYILTMQQMLTAHQSSTQILVASVRRVEDIVTLAAAGVSSFTLSPGLLEELLHVPITVATAQEFETIAALGSSH